MEDTTKQQSHEVTEMTHAKKWLVKYDDQTQQWEPEEDLLDAEEQEEQSLLRQLEKLMLVSMNGGSSACSTFNLQHWKMQYMPRQAAPRVSASHELLLVSPSGLLFRSPEEVVQMYKDGQMKKVLTKTEEEGDDLNEDEEEEVEEAEEAEEAEDEGGGRGRGGRGGCRLRGEEEGGGCREED